MTIEISDWNDLNDVRNDLSANYVLKNNLDSGTTGYNTHASGSANGGNGWRPIGFSTSFTGSFDGQGNSITGIVANRSGQDNVGLFGIVDESSIKNVGVKNVDIIGFDYVGGLVGDKLGNNKDKLYNSYSTGSVEGDNNVGGLVGSNSGKISQTYSTVNVNGNGNVGGLVGRNDDDISQSYSRGNVNGGTEVGGFLGNNDSGGGIYNSYSTGSVEGDNNVGGLVGLAGSKFSSTVNDSYWDMQTSGQGSGSSRGTGLTTDEMTGSDAPDNMTDFDFNNVWETTASYPELLWKNFIPIYLYNGASWILLPENKRKVFDGNNWVEI